MLKQMLKFPEANQTDTAGVTIGESIESSIVCNIIGIEVKRKYQSNSLLLLFAAMREVFHNKKTLSALKTNVEVKNSCH